MLSNLCSQCRICCLSLELNFRFAVALADSEIPCWLPEEDCAHWLREKFAPSLLALLRRCFLWISACLSWWHSYSCYFVAGLFSAKLTVWDAVSLRNFCLCYLEQHSGGWSWEIHLRLSLPILRLRTLLCIWELGRVFAYSINYCQILQKFYCPFLTKFFSWKQRVASFQTDCRVCEKSLTQHRHCPYGREMQCLEVKPHWACVQVWCPKPPEGVSWQVMWA